MQKVGLKSFVVVLCCLCCLFFVVYVACSLLFVLLVLCCLCCLFFVVYVACSLLFMLLVLCCSCCLFFITKLFLPQVSCLFTSSYVLVATAIDRYVAICHPLAFHHWTLRRLNILIGGWWLCGLGGGGGRGLWNEVGGW